MSDHFVSIENFGAVRRIWLDRADAANAQNTQMLQELDDAFAQASTDDTVRVVILGGKGKHFSSGHDLKESQGKRTDPTPEERWRYEERYYLGYCMNIWDCPKPVIAQVQGACVAGGFMVANMADLIIASEDAWFWDSIIFNIGVASTEVLFQPWVMGLRHAKEFLLTGERITAAEAWRIGMVNRVVAREQLDESAMAMANRIAEAHPFATQTLKKSLNRTYDIQGFRNAIQAHFDLHQLTHTTGEFAQVRARGMSSIIAGNKAELQGKG